MSVDVLNAYEKFISELGLEDREGQRIATWNLVETVRGGVGEALALQAPTGTGKSVSALLAGVEGAREGRRTAIGTATVMLSEQYWEDIVKVSGVFPDVNFFVLKGAAHYICGNKVAEWQKRMERLAGGSVKMKQALTEGLDELRTWQDGSSVMDVPPSWAQADAENCRDCRDGSVDKGLNCEYAVARGKAKEADVVVTSHAMLMIDLGLKRSVEIKKQKALDAGLSVADIKEASILGKVDMYIFDEAHKLGGLVSDSSISHWDVSFLQKRNVLSRMGFSRAGALMNHFAEFAELKGNDKYSAMDKWVSVSACEKAAQDLLTIWPTPGELAMMEATSRAITDDDECKRARDTVKAMETARDVLLEMSVGNASGFLAFWFNGVGYAMKEMAIRPWFAETLKSFRVAYISATLGVAGDELYALNTLGVKPTWDQQVESPFDYSKQMEVAVVDWKRVDGRGDGLISCVEWFARRLSGGTVVLTGGHKTKEWITRELLGRGFDVRSQAMGGRGSAKKDSAAVQEHKAMCDSDMEDQMLVGVDTFSTGMNLAGAGLTTLFIHGIKGIREDSPYVAWRKRWIEDSLGGDGFTDYELPEKAIVLEQQIGRLIRTQSDKGCVLLAYRTGDAREKAVVELALSAFDGYNQVELTEVGKRWWQKK